MVVSPLTTLVAGNLTYAPSPGVGWYLWWLLLFDVVYVSFQTAPPVDEALAEALTGAHSPAAARGPPLLLSTLFRIGAGIGICGFALLPFLVLTKGSFASMPVSIGSVTCDFLMFYLGLEAKKQGWLERPLTEQLDIHPFVLLGFVLIEAAGIAVASLDVDKFGLIVVLLAGMFCLDMSLLVLLTFQRWGNVETRATRFLARGAFGVYLLHPLVVTAATRVYLNFAGKDVNYPVGFGFVAVVSLLVVWPLAYSLAQLPGLRAVL
jgi:peptidoglycan/LPS O-acetylase OafA/YrhL